MLNQNHIKIEVPDVVSDKFYTLGYDTLTFFRRLFKTIIYEHFNGDRCTFEIKKEYYCMHRKNASLNIVTYFSELQKVGIIEGFGSGDIFYYNFVVNPLHLNLAVALTDPKASECASKAFQYAVKQQS